MNENHKTVIGRWVKREQACRLVCLMLATTLRNWLAAPMSIPRNSINRACRFMLACCHMKTCNNVIENSLNHFEPFRELKIYRFNTPVKQKNSKASLIHTLQ